MSLDTFKRFNNIGLNEKILPPEKTPAPFITLEELKKRFSHIEIPQVQEDLKKIEEIVLKLKQASSPSGLDEPEDNHDVKQCSVALHDCQISHQDD